MDYIDACPIIIVERIQNADLGQSDSAGLFSLISGQADLTCHMLALEEIANRLNARSDAQVIGLFCATVATYANYLHPEALLAIKAAYLRFPYSDDIALPYFAGLRLTGVDLRDHLRRIVREDWSFTRPRQNAATWHHYLYLASLDEPGALKAISDKLADTPDGTDLTNLLESLNDLPGPAVSAILRGFLGDPRRAASPTGPGMTVGRLVEMYLEDRAP